MPQEALVSLKPSAFVPSISFAGDEPRYVIRGQNLFQRPKSENVMYAAAYKGSRDIDEPAPLKTLTGTIAWTTGTDIINGTGTSFRTEIRIGSPVSAPNGTSNTFFFIEEVIDNETARVSRIFSDSQSGRTAYVHGIIYALGAQRVTHIRGNIAKYRGGHYIGVGDGTVKLNGQDLPIRQVEIMTILTGASAGGNITVRTAATGLTGTPIDTVIAVALNDTVNQVAAKVKTALDAVANITAFSEVAVSGDKVYWIKKAAATNDATMNLAVTAGGGTGVTSNASSDNAVAGNTFALASTPRYAMYEENDEVYTQVDFGITLPGDTATDPLVTMSVSPTAGTKKMPNAIFGFRFVAKSDANLGSTNGATTGGTGGYSQPSQNFILAMGAVDKRARVTFNKPMNVGEGQNAWDIYATKYEDATAAAINNTQGPWFYYETVTAAQLAAFNSVTNGTVSGLFWDLEFADGELDALDILLSFDNFGPYESENVDILATEAGLTPIFFGCLGKRTVAQPKGTSPGPGIVVGKPDNPEAIMRDKAVTTFNGDTIVAVTNVRGRFWLSCESSLQTAILTGIPNAPITCRSFWDLGFRNRYNLRFFKDYAFGFSTGGFFRSIGVGDTSEVDFEFSNPIDDYTTDWICSHALAEMEPKNKVMCFFFAGKDKSSGFYRTIVIPFSPTRGFWNMPIVLEGRGQKESNTIVGTAGASTNIAVTIEAADSVALAGGKTINVAVTNLDNAATVAGKIRTALNADSDVTDFFIVGGSGAEYTVTVKSRAALDSTMSLTHGAITGIPADSTSVRSFVPVQDFIVSGVATVGQSMYFLAGGVNNSGAMVCDTYEFDSNDGIPLDCFIAWAYSETDQEDQPTQILGVASAIGSFESPSVEIHGVSRNGEFDLDTLEAGHADPLKTITLESTGDGIWRRPEQRQNVESFSKWTARFAFESVNGSGRFDELNLLIGQNASRT